MFLPLDTLSNNSPMFIDPKALAYIAGQKASICGIDRQKGVSEDKWETKECLTSGSDYACMYQTRVQPRAEKCGNRRREMQGESEVPCTGTKMPTSARNTTNPSNTKDWKKKRYGGLTATWTDDFPASQVTQNTRARTNVGDLDRDQPSQAQAFDIVWRMRIHPEVHANERTLVKSEACLPLHDGLLLEDKHGRQAWLRVQALTDISQTKQMEWMRHKTIMIGTHRDGIKLTLIEAALRHFTILSALGVWPSSWRMRVAYVHASALVSACRPTLCQTVSYLTQDMLFALHVRGPWNLGTALISGSKWVLPQSLKISEYILQNALEWQVNRDNLPQKLRTHDFHGTGCLPHSSHTRQVMRMRGTEFIDPFQICWTHKAAVSSVLFMLVLIQLLCSPCVCGLGA